MEAHTETLNGVANSVRLTAVEGIPGAGLPALVRRAPVAICNPAILTYREFMTLP